MQDKKLTIRCLGCGTHRPIMPETRIQLVFSNCWETIPLLDRVEMVSELSEIVELLTKELVKDLKANPETLDQLLSDLDLWPETLELTKIE